MGRSEHVDRRIRSRPLEWYVLMLGEEDVGSYLATFKQLLLKRLFQMQNKSNLLDLKYCTYSLAHHRKYME